MSIFTCGVQYKTVIDFYFIFLGKSIFNNNVAIFEKTNKLEASNFLADIKIYNYDNK